MVEHSVVCFGTFTVPSKEETGIKIMGFLVDISNSLCMHEWVGWMEYVVRMLQHVHVDTCTCIT